MRTMETTDNKLPENNIQEQAHQVPNEMQQKCRSRLTTSIVVAILLFPTAIASIVKSSIGIKKADDGNVEEAAKLYTEAGKFIKLSVILGIINYLVIILYIVMEIILIAEMTNAYNSYDYYYY